jgi:hypothetical protein
MTRVAVLACPTPVTGSTFSQSQVRNDARELGLQRVLAAEQVIDELGKGAEAG